MHILAFVIFLVVSVFGAFMALKLIQKQPIPAGLGGRHGLAAAVGVIILLIAQLTNDYGFWAWVALGIFVSGAIGGKLFFRVLFKDKPAPLFLVFGHGSLGFAGLVTLAIAIWGGG